MYVNNASTKVLYLLLLLSLYLPACTTNGPQERIMHASALAIQENWQLNIVHTSIFSLASFAPSSLRETNTLTIYIEGDGQAWLNESTPSFDPTPTIPMALKLALRDKKNTSVYLARPCQYVMAVHQKNCTNKYWTSHRYAPEVISANNEAISQIKSRYGASRLILIGHSGGGAIATLVASLRTDIIGLVTVAGNLDTDLWTTQKGLSPLSNSLNPKNAWRRLVSTPQVHFVGEKDQVITPSISDSYRDIFPINEKPVTIKLSEFDHICCWDEAWPTLLDKINFAPK